MTTHIYENLPEMHPSGTKSSARHLASGVCASDMKKSHADTVTVQTWDLMFFRPGRAAVTDPDRRLQSLTRPNRRRSRRLRISRPGVRVPSIAPENAVKSKDFMAFLFFWQSLHTFAHLLHTLQKSHELFASLAQRVFRCTKKRILREEHPRQLAAFLCVHLPDGFKDHFTRDFCCHRRFVFRGFLRAKNIEIDSADDLIRAVF